MDAAHLRLMELFPSVADIRADAAARYPDRPHLRDHYEWKMLECLYAETRRLVLNADERAARAHPPTDPPEDDDEDETEEFDHGDPVGIDPEAVDHIGLDVPIPYVPVDPEAIDYSGVAPDLAVCVTRREVRILEPMR